MGAKIDLEYMSMRKVRIPNLYWNLEGPFFLKVGTLKVIVVFIQKV